MERDGISQQFLGFVQALVPQSITATAMMLVGTLLFASWRERPVYVVASPIVGVVIGAGVSVVLGEQWAILATAVGTIVGVNTVLFLEGKTALEVFEEIQKQNDKRNK